MDQVATSGFWNVYNFTGLPVFGDWERGAAEIKRNKTTQLIVKIARWVCRILVVVCVFAAIAALPVSMGKTFLWIVLAFLLWQRSLAGIILDNISTSSNTKYWDAAYDHADMLLQAAADKLMAGQWHYYRHDRIGIAYNSDLFMYMNADTSELVRYIGSDIKDVTRERLHTGSDTVGQSKTYGGGTAIGNTGIAVGGGVTDMEATTTDHYEWHFDVMTAFMDYPKVSIVWADSPSVENAVGEAYGILKK